LDFIIVMAANMHDNSSARDTTKPTRHETHTRPGAVATLHLI
jgi:hypothetical protein